MAVSPSQVCGKAPVGPEALTYAMHSNSDSRRSATAKASATAVQTILGHRSAAFTLTVYGRIFDTDLDLSKQLREIASSGILHPAPEGRDRDLFARST